MGCGQSDPSRCEVQEPGPSCSGPRTVAVGAGLSCPLRVRAVYRGDVCITGAGQHNPGTLHQPTEQGCALSYRFQLCPLLICESNAKSFRPRGILTSNCW